MEYLKEFFILILFLFIGNIIKFFVPFPIPDVVYAMIILFIFLAYKLIDVKSIEKTSLKLLENLSFLFIPAGVGIINEFDFVKEFGAKVVMIIAISTIITTVVTGKTVEFIKRRRSV